MQESNRWIKLEWLSKAAIGLGIATLMLGSAYRWARADSPPPASAYPAGAAAPQPRAVLEPGHVKVTVFASSRKGLKGRYIYSPLVSYVSNMAFAPDGSLYFDVGVGGSGLPLAKITPQGKVVVVARPEVMDPRHMSYFDFGPIAITPKGRVYVLYRGLAEIKADGKIDLVPLRNEAGKLFTDDNYPDLESLTAGPDGRLYVTDQRTVWRIGSDYVLWPIKYPANELPPLVRVHFYWRGVEGYNFISGVVGPDGYIYAVGFKLLPGGKLPPVRQQRFNVYRIGEGGRPDLRPDARLELLVPAKDMPGESQGAAAMDRNGNLYVSTRNAIYKISPTESPK